MPSSKGLPYPGIELASLVSPALAGGFFTTWEAHPTIYYSVNIMKQAIPGIVDTASTRQTRPPDP